ncbi:MAG: hypothetical protein ACKPKO_46310, partial [Candidatus Fonsibacter sp.]
HQQVAYAGVHRKVSAVDCDTCGLLEGTDAALAHPVPQLIHPLARQWDAGGMAPQEVQPQKIEPGYVRTLLGQGYLALITVERLLDATLRVLRDGQGIVLGIVLVGFAVHDDIGALLNLRTSTPC